MPASRPLGYLVPLIVPSLRWPRPGSLGPDLLTRPSGGASPCLLGEELLGDHRVAGVWDPRRNAGLGRAHSSPRVSLLKG